MPHNYTYEETTKRYDKRPEANERAVVELLSLRGEK